MASSALHEVPVDDDAFREPVEEDKEISSAIRLEKLLMKKICDPAYLPSHYNLQLAFGTGGFKPGGLGRFCWKNRHEVINREFVADLAEYFAERIRLYSASSKETIRILEVGAGNGQLGYFLQKSLDRIQPRASKITVTDNGSGKISSPLPIEHVDVEEALTAHKPTIVLSAWMPYQKDWTQYFRSTPSVMEYLLIGEPACCGKTGETWCDNPNERFKGMFLDKVSRYQICAIDQVYGDNGSFGHQSVTYSFRRMKNPEQR